ncbi:hypothetical protein M409DRAFT_55146 [Zasmidium cellare ATCC 36951]|uniref:Carboxylic ester hydrolase n=1 Tax=Zasmidium cellare ATCC 36951 TaxID=1080233 RepID=A0A6A6CJH4_ZASCE|nr:uncharacterized protein M409DRAFT_55146 [Zasmidium cellare ATCC 36951]KAF2166300.1 hypothetical protein M409DRAFT_55146 [Zasmidium cellare ATCC 36951]
MHISTTLCTLLPALASAMPALGEIKAVTPTMAELSRVYPNINIDYITGDLESNETFHVDATQERTLGYKLVAAGLTACSARIAGTSAAHILVAGAGFVGGREFIMYFWHGGALQAAGLPTGNSKRDCNTGQTGFQSSAHFAGQYGLKMAGKYMHCYAPDSGQLGYASGLGSMIAKGMQQSNQCSLSTQFTIYYTSTNRVLGRYHLELDTTRTDVGPFEITGGDSCTVSV